MFSWRYAILAAVFVYNITAGWYSKEQLWATPCELIYGEPFPDSSVSGYAIWLCRFNFVAKAQTQETGS
jgi:hypothetical protein